MWWGASGKRWSDADRLLTLALTAFEDSLCSGCGQPKDQAWSEEAGGYYEVQELTCQGCKASGEHGHGKQPEPGTKSFVVFERPPDSVTEAGDQPSDEQADAE